jgi:hypothetical protein
MACIPLKRERSESVDSIDYSMMQSNTPRLRTEDLGCLCAKSKCLKLYCACFAKGKYCGDACKCSGCHNLLGDPVSTYRSVFQTSMNIL